MSVIARCQWADERGHDQARCRTCREYAAYLLGVEAGRTATTSGAVVIDDAAEERAVRALCADEAWEDDWMIAMNVVGIVVAALRGQSE